MESAPTKREDAISKTGPPGKFYDAWGNEIGDTLSRPINIVDAI